MNAKLVFWGIALLLGTPLWAFRPIAAPLDGAGANLALGGYDPMGYWTVGAPVKGSPLLFHEWRGATWYFRSQENRRKFIAEPERYAPAFGGYCAYCLAESEEAATGGDPLVFLIHKDRLYILQSEAVREKWMEDLDTYTAKAERIYTGLLAEVAAE
jgi:YHS domain-containing protein